jgi:membrane-associated phospholipid phosphatase
MFNLGSNLGFGKRLSSFAQFLQQWFSHRWQRFFVAILGIYAPLLIFVFLASQIWQLEGGLSWDVSILTAIHSTARPTLDRVAATLTDFGTIWGVLPVSIAISLSLLYLKRWRSLTYFFITLFGGAIINRLAKACFHRARPSLWEYPALTDFSFPSGHAMSSMIFVAALVILTWDTRWRVWSLLFGGAFAAAIGWTRLYLGVHYPSDILAGWMISIAWAMSMRLVIKPQLSQTVEREKEPVLQNEGMQI